MRISDLPQAIYRAINGWRVWATLLLLATLIINEAALGIREGQTIVESLTRILYYRMPLLTFACAVIVQAAIGAVPFMIGVAMTMIDFAFRQRRRWREDGVAEGEKRGIELGRAVERRRAIDAIMTNPVLTDTAKLEAIAAINAAADD